MSRPAKPVFVSSETFDTREEAVSACKAAGLFIFDSDADWDILRNDDIEAMVHMTRNGWEAHTVRLPA